MTIIVQVIEWFLLKLVSSQYLCRLIVKYNQIIVCFPLKNLYFRLLYRPAPFLCSAFSVDDVLKLWVCWFTSLASHLIFFKFYKLTTRRCTWNNSIGCAISSKILHLKVIAGHIFETLIKCCCLFHPISVNFFCMFFKTSKTQLNQF